MDIESVEFMVRWMQMKRNVVLKNYFTEKDESDLRRMCSELGSEDTFLAAIDLQNSIRRVKDEYDQLKINYKRYKIEDKYNYKGKWCEFFCHLCCPLCSITRGVCADCAYGVNHGKCNDLGSDWRQNYNMVKYIVNCKNSSKIPRLLKGAEELINLTIVK